MYVQWFITILLACAIASPGAARAVPLEPTTPLWIDPPPVYPAFVKVVGAQTTAGVPDPTGTFVVTVRDYWNYPLPGVTTDLDFVNCTDMKLCSVQSAGVVLECGTKRLRAFTNAAGQATFVVLGAGVVNGSVVPPAIAPGPGRGCVRLYLENTQVGTATAVVYDLNGALGGQANGVSPLDLAIAKNEIGAAGAGAPYRGRDDYSADGTLTAVDLAFLRTVIGLSGAGVGSGAGCAAGGAVRPYCP